MVWNELWKDSIVMFLPPQKFLSKVRRDFRGKDVRKTFVDHLYEALSAAGLRVFLDTYELKKGETIDLSLGAAIESTAICIPIFSKGYARSAWCLIEVTCMLNSSGLITPLFYDVKPTRVRFTKSNSNPYAQSFAKHYRRYQRDNIQPCKQSLQEICARSGWSMELTGGYEEQLVKRVTCDVINSLEKVSLDVATHTIGVEDMKKVLIQSLDLRSIIGIGGIGKTTLAKAVSKQGILGIGYLGKTTLAKAVYNEVYRGLEGIPV